MDDTPPVDPAADSPPPEMSVGEVFKVLGMLSTVVVGLCAGCVAMLSAGDTSSDSPGPYVTVACRDWARERLKAPSTADFGEDWAQDLGGGRWRVTGVVDTQNAFGAVVRAKWTCEATYADGETTLVSVAVAG